MPSHHTEEYSGRKRPLDVLIVDDHALIRQGIRSMLESYADIEVVGEASDGIEAILFADKHHPTVMLMDINMPRMNGREATARIRSRYPDTIIIGLSVNATTENQEAMRRAGAVRLIPKEVVVDQLYDAIRDAIKNRKASGWSAMSEQG